MGPVWGDPCKPSLPFMSNFAPKDSFSRKLESLPIGTVNDSQLIPLNTYSESFNLERELWNRGRPTCSSIEVIEGKIGLLIELLRQKCALGDLLDDQIEGRIRKTLNNYRKRKRTNIPYKPGYIYALWCDGANPFTKVGRSKECFIRFKQHRNKYQKISGGDILPSHFTTFAERVIAAVLAQKQRMGEKKALEEFYVSIDQAYCVIQSVIAWLEELNPDYKLVEGFKVHVPNHLDVYIHAEVNRVVNETPCPDERLYPEESSTDDEP